MDLISTMPKCFCGSSKTVSVLELVISNSAFFLINFTFKVSVSCIFKSSNLIIANDEISSVNGTSIFINFLSLCFKISLSLEKKWQ